MAKFNDQAVEISKSRSKWHSNQWCYQLETHCDFLNSNAKTDGVAKNLRNEQNRTLIQYPNSIPSIPHDSNQNQNPLPHLPSKVILEPYNNQFQAMPSNDEMGSFL